MNIYVVGSIASPTETAIYPTPDDFERVREEFSGACQALGSAIVRAGHTVMIDIISWKRLQEQTIAAPFLIEGIKREKSTSKSFEIWLYQPKDMEPNAPDTPGIIDTMAELKAPIPDNPSNISWTQKIFISEEDFYTNMRRADAFILIGGGSGTALTGQTASYLGKPVVALTAFGGAAQQSFDLVLSAIYRDLNVQTQEMVALTQPWDKLPEKNRSAADDVVRFTADLQVALKKRLVPNDRTLRTFLAMIPLILLLWVIIFVEIQTMLPAVGYIFLLLLASILGTGLRLLLATQGRNSPVFTFTYIWTQITLSFLVAFGLMLVYLIGGISFTGNVVDLVKPPTNAIATGLSVVGFSAGFLLPVARLRTQLGEAIGTPKDTNNP